MISPTVEGLIQQVLLNDDSNQISAIRSLYNSPDVRALSHRTDLTNHLKQKFESSEDETLRGEIFSFLAWLDVSRGLPSDLATLLLTSNEGRCSELLLSIGKLLIDEPGYSALKHLTVDSLDSLVNKWPSLEMRRKITWFIAKLGNVNHRPPFQKFLLVLPLLMEGLHSTDNEWIARSAEALSELSDGPNANIQEILDASETLPERLVELLLSSVEEIVVYSLRTVGNIITGNDTQTQSMIEAGAVPNLLWLLDYPNEKIIREACWTVSNVVAGSMDQIQTVINAALIPKVIPLIDSTNEDTAADALWVISNILSSGTETQKEYVLNERPLGKIIQILKQDEIEGTKRYRPAVDSLYQSLAFAHRRDQFERYEELRNDADLLNVLRYLPDSLEVRKIIEYLSGDSNNGENAQWQMDRLEQHSGDEQEDIVGEDVSDLEIPDEDVNQSTVL